MRPVEVAEPSRGPPGVYTLGRTGNPKTPWSGWPSTSHTALSLGLEAAPERFPHKLREHLGTRDELTPIAADVTGEAQQKQRMEAGEAQLDDDGG